MYREERRICYTNDELSQALALYSENAGRAFPGGAAPNLTYQSSPTLKVQIANWNDRERYTEFNETEITSALILLSKKIGIPIPMQAEKTIELARDTVIFVMKIPALH